MSLLDEPTQPDPNSLEERQARTAREIRGSVRLLFGQMRDTFRTNYAALWDNADGLTPQQVCDALGPDAVQLFALASVLSDTVNHAQPGTISQGIPEGVTVTPNADGTVTIAGG